ncbi:MAG: patatin-like phospholipase family protein, partial [Verrucomicrobiota bacterium]|nr:patatin-like phospholipase family protein [Verrucomicrobiota bacterium]
QTGRRINDLFDLMVGTCTGALQTVLLTTPGKDGQPKFTAKELLDIYNTDEKKLFYHPWYHRLLTLNGVIGPKYQTTARYALFQKCLDGLYFDQLLNNVVIPAYDVRSQNPMLFLNWNQPGREDTNFELASLLMGAVSPPGVFPSVIFGLHGKRLVLVDGTLFADNPSIVAVLLAMSIYPNKKYILVTLGTGVTEETPHLTTEVLNWGELQWSKQLLPTIYKSNAKFNTMLVQKMFPVPLDLYYFNTRVSAFDTQLDNVSQWNIERLNRYGKQMVVENQERLAELASRLVQP